MHLKRTMCPYCGRENPLVDDGQSEAKPSDGDWSICWTCGEVAIFHHASPGGLRLPDKGEKAEIAADRELQDALFMREVALKVVP